MSSRPLRTEGVIQEDDDVHVVFIVALIVAAVSCTLLGIGWAWLEWSHLTEQLGGYEQPVPPPRAPRSIAGVNQSLIHIERHGQKLEAEQRRLLEQFGWVDQSQGIVRIPIDEAIRITAEESQR